MTDPANFNTPIRREEDSALHEELINRLNQHGVVLDVEDADLSELADLLSAVDVFEAAVVRAGGDLFIDAPDSSEPEDPRFVLPHPHADERVGTYIKRIQAAARQLEQLKS